MSMIASSGWLNRARPPADYIPILDSVGNLIWVPGNSVYVPAQPTAPDSTIADGWLDTSTDPPVLKVWNGSAWAVVGISTPTSPVVSVAGRTGVVVLSEADIAGLVADLAAKANSGDMTTALAAKANTSDMTAALATKANSSDMTTALAAKANTSDMTTALAAKANTSDMTTALATKAPLDSPALTGTPTAPTAAAGTGNTQLATTAYSDLAGSFAAPLWTASTTYLANKPVVLPTGGRGYVTATRTSRASWDATERAAWTFIAGGHYELLATGSGNWVCPTGITKVKPKITGPGGPGTGGGAAALTGGIATQVGGPGGGAGMVTEPVITGLVAGTSYAYTTGTAAIGGTGGAASTGATGSAGGLGTVGTAATFTGPGGTVYSAQAGGRGTAPVANSNTGASAGVMGGALLNSIALATPGTPGSGGPAVLTGGYGAAWIGDVVGGAGGRNATSTVGGGGGQAATAIGAVIQTNGNANSATTTGTDGAAATLPGCGGGGGGGGAPGGAGGAGGAGGPGKLEVTF